MGQRTSASASLEYTGQEASCPNAKDLAGLVRVVRSGLVPNERVVAVLEPTSMGWYPLVLWLARAGCTVIRVKGQRVRALRCYLSEYAKTDVVDAHVLASLPSFGECALQPLHLPSAEQLALSRLTKQRVRYREEAISATNRRLLELIRWRSRYSRKRYQKRSRSRGASRSVAFGGLRGNVARTNHWASGSSIGVG